MKTLMKADTLSDKIQRNIYEGYNRGIINDTEMVSIIVLIFDTLNLTSVSDYARQENKTYRGVKKYCKKVVNINKFTFVINNK